MSKPETAEEIERDALAPKYPFAEVTPEMLKAGAEIIAEFEFGWASPQDFARRVFLAMEALRPRGAHERMRDNLADLADELKNRAKYERKP